MPKMIPAVLLLLLLSVFLPFGTSLSFSFPSFNQSTSSLLNFSGDAFWNGDIRLTRPYGMMSVGRAVYPQPLLLWDSVTRNLADFTTHFSFRITPNYNTSGCSDFCAGDGLAFFLWPYLDPFPPNSSGGCLGLFDKGSGLDTSKNRLVAVDFDTYPNEWDPHAYHIGIDINSVDSSSYVTCKRGITLGQSSNATISYDSSTQMLSVIAMYNDVDVDPYSIEKSNLSYKVDLRDILPGKVAVGFSAATGGSSVESHEILSWDFSSNSLPPTPPSPSNDTRTSDEKVDSKIELLAGLVSGIGAVMIVFLIKTVRRVSPRFIKEKFNETRLQQNTKKPQPTRSRMSPRLKELAQEQDKQKAKRSTAQDRPQRQKEEKEPEEQPYPSADSSEEVASGSNGGGGSGVGRGGAGN